MQIANELNNHQENELKKSFKEFSSTTQENGKALVKLTKEATYSFMHNFLYEKIILPFYKINMFVFKSMVRDSYRAAILKKDVKKNGFKAVTKLGILIALLGGASYVTIKPAAFAATSISKIISPVDKKDVSKMSSELNETGKTKMNQSVAHTNKVMPNGDYAPAGVKVMKMKDLNGKTFNGVDKMFVNPTTHEQKTINKYAVPVQKAAHTYGVNPSVMMAQAMLESGWGKSDLATQGQNFFGIKGKGDIGSIKMPTREETKDGKSYMINADFARYSDAATGMAANGDLLRNPDKRGLDKNRYSGTWVENTHSYKDATKAIKDAGYATDGQYTETLNKFISTYGLYVMDSHSVHNTDLTQAK